MFLLGGIRMRVLQLFVIVALGASLTACSGGPATTGDGNAGGTGEGTNTDGGGGTDASGLPDPCALVTKAEVEAAIGGPVTAEGEELEPGPNHYAFGIGRQCVFGPVNGVVSPAFITVFTYSADGWEQYATNQASFSDFHEVEGIGDEALAGGATQIGVHQGDLVLDIQLGFETAGDPAGEGRLQELATTALGRL